MGVIVPTVTVEVAFGASPLDPNPAVWTELEQTDVLGYADSMGRRSETDTATAPATASIMLDNGARTYDPAYTDGVYFGDLRPHLQVRVKAVIGATTRVLFLGVITDEGWQQVEHRHPASLRCRIVLTDQLGHINRRSLLRPLFESALDAVGNSFATHTVRHWSLGAPGQEAHAPETFSPDTTAGLSDEREAPLGLAAYPPTSGNAQPSSTILTGPPLRPGMAASLATQRGWVAFPSALEWGTPATDRVLGFAFRLLAPVGRRTRIMRAAAPGSASAGWFINTDGYLSVSLDGLVELESLAPIELNRTYFLADQWDTSAGLGTMWIDGVAQNPPSSFTGGVIVSLVAGAADDGTFPTTSAISDVWAIEEILTAAQHATLRDMFRGTAGLKTDRAADLVLAAAGVTSNLATTNAGRVSIVATGEATVSPPSLLQAIEQTEQGRLFFDHRSTSPQMKLITREQFATSTRQTTAQFVLSDQVGATTALRYSAPVVGARPDVTRATVSGPSGAATVEDRAATALVGVTAVSVSTLAEPPTDAAALAETLLAEGSTAQVVRSVRVQPSNAARGIDALSIRLFDRVTLVRQPLNIGDADSADYIVEGLSTDIAAGAGDWSMSLVLSPAITPAQRWTWGVDKFATTDLPGRLTS